MRTMLIGGALLFACSPPPHVVLRIEDPQAVATDARAVAARIERGALRSTSIDEPLPVDIVVVGDEPGERTLWVEAWDGDGGVLARAQARATLERTTGAAVVVELGAACDIDGAEGTYCSFDADAVAGICRDRVCAVSLCGDAVVDARREECDDGAGNLDLPNATCRRTCVFPDCGDGIADDLAGELCDGLDTGGLRCTSLGFYSGVIGCASNCQPDVSGCSEFCGDGTINGDEACDGSDVDARTCLDFGFGGGTVACAPDCTFVTSGCVGGCGNDVADSLEYCDGADLNGHDCAELGYYAGTPTCAASCDGISPTGCSGRCGDGIINGSELCDGAALPAGVDCASFGYYGGSPTCLADCAGVAQTGCLGYCGDGVLNGGEECDGLEQDGHFCSEVPTFSAGRYGCDAGCRRTLDPCFDEGGWSVDNFGVGLGVHSVFAIDATHLYIGSSGPHVLHADGALWRDLGLPSNGGVSDIWGSAPDDLWVGTGADELLYYDGVTWTRHLMSFVPHVWGSGPGDVFAVGAGGVIRHYDGAWRTMTSGTTFRLEQVFGTAANDVFAVGWNGTILRYTDYEVSPGSYVREWRPMVSGTSANLYALWGTSSLDLYAGGSNVILRYDGSDWVAMAGATGTTIEDLWGDGAGNVYAAGSLGVLRYDGNPSRLWEPVTDPAATGNLYAVGGRAGDDVWAGGWLGLALHFDGLEWSEAWPRTGSLRAVHGARFDDLWAVGGTGTILHYDGDRWLRTRAVDGLLLNDVWARGEDDVFVVGYDATVLHWEGAVWTELTPAAIPAGRTLHGIWGSANGDLFVVGDGGLAVHHDAAAGTWALMPNSTTRDLFDVWGDDAGTLVATGSEESILLWSGVSWEVVLEAPGSSYAVGGLDGLPGPQMWAVASSGGGTRPIRYSDGGAWQLVHTTSGVFDLAVLTPTEIYLAASVGVIAFDGASERPADTGIHETISAIHADYATGVVGVGSNGAIVRKLARPWDARATGVAVDLEAVWIGATTTVAVGAGGSVLRTDGSRWNSDTAVTAARLYGIWGAAEDDLYAVGEGGVILHDTGDGFALQSSVDSRDLYAVWGSGPGDVWAVGDAGVIVHATGGAWSVDAGSPVATPLFGVWGGDGELVAVGAGGVILHRSGGSWSTSASGTSADLFAVWGPTASDVYAVGDGGTLLHFDGSSWAPLPSGTSADLRAVTGVTSREILMAGQGGVIRVCDGVGCSPMTSQTATDLMAVAISPERIAMAVGVGGDARGWAGRMPTAYGGACARPMDLYCGTSLVGSTRGHPVRALPIGCPGVAERSSEKVFYRFHSPVDGEATVELSAHGGDLDLIVSGAATVGSCDPESRCLGASAEVGAGTETVTWPVTAGAIYFMVVDDTGGGVGYTISLACAKQ